MARAMQSGDFRQSKGFTYLGLLALMAISGIAMAGVAILWHQESQREREKELLFIGDAYRKAIVSYYETSPEQPKQYPQTLNDLLLDKRFPIIKRHLRKLYIDPMMQKKDWGLMLQQGKIVGVYTKSKLAPIKRTGFASGYESFAGAEDYSAWKFTAVSGLQ